MARPRSSGGVSLIRSPSMARSPLVISSSPAIMRSSVDLPEPDGPTKTTNSRSAISRSTPLMTSMLPKDLVAFFNESVAISFPLFHGAEGETAHELALRDPSEDKDRRNGQRGRRREFCPEQSFR